MKAIMILGIVFSCISGQVHATYVDQSHVPVFANAGHVVGFNNGNKIDVAQTFTVGVSGTLTGIDVWVDRYFTTTGPLLFDVRTATLEVPTGSDSGPNVLASGEILPTEIENVRGLGPVPPILTHLDFGKNGPAVEMGEVLALVLQSYDQGPISSYTVKGTSLDQYQGGSQYSRSSTTGQWRLVTSGAGGDWDIVFRTYVVPEPKTMALLVLGSVTLLSRRH